MWTDEDRAEVLEVMAYRAALCARCGTHPDHAHGPTRPVPVRRVCPTCTQVDAEQEKLSKEASKSPAATRGVSIALVPAHTLQQ